MGPTPSPTSMSRNIRSMRNLLTRSTMTSMAMMSMITSPLTSTRSMSPHMRLNISMIIAMSKSTITSLPTSTSAPCTGMATIPTPSYRHKRSVSYGYGGDSYKHEPKYYSSYKPSSYGYGGKSYGKSYGY